MMEQAMFDKKASHFPNRMLAEMVDKNSSAALSSVKSWLQSARYANYSTHFLLEGGLFPAIDGMVAINEQVTKAVLDTLRGERSVADLMRETTTRAQSAVRFPQLMKTLGKQLFGSAVFQGEQVLDQDEHFRLVYLPPAGTPAEGVAMFHTGGAIPYGDRIFRLLPEFNFYDPFLSRGIAVYAMEYKGDRAHLNFGTITMESLIDAIDRFSQVAFEHHGKRKMVMEGYCGQGAQALTFVAAKPVEADQRFWALTTFVSPVDGSKCEALAAGVHVTPEKLLDSNMSLFGMTGGYLPGDHTRLGLDMSLKSVFYKTALGYAMAGWHRSDWATVQSMDDLNSNQRRDLAGAYWVSADNANRFPIPVDVARYTSKLFKNGIPPSGELPYLYKGNRISLANIASQTQLKVMGFYGGRDPMVPDRTAHCLINLLGERYQHVVHPDAGHVSYVLSPKLWDSANPRGFKPNPVDMILKAAPNQGAAQKGDLSKKARKAAEVSN